MKEFDYYLPEYIEEVYRRFDQGGILYFIERTDTNQFLLNPLSGGYKSHQEYIPDSDVGWSDDISFFNLSEAHLSEEYAKEFGKTNLTEGGCRYCHNNAKQIPIKITEHEFVAPKTKTDE
jgi:hypothetical protein